MEVEVINPSINMKRHKLAKSFLTVGLIVTILSLATFVVVSVVSILLGLIIGVIAFGFVAALVAIITGMFGGSASSEPIDFSQFGQIIAPFAIVSLIFFILAICALVGLVLVIVALAMFNKAQNKKKGLVTGILAIVGGLVTLVLPFEIVGGILALTLSDDHYATAYSDRMTKKELKKAKKEAKYSADNVSDAECVTGEIKEGE